MEKISEYELFLRHKDEFKNTFSSIGDFEYELFERSIKPKELKEGEIDITKYVEDNNEEVCKIRNDFLNFHFGIIFYRQYIMSNILV